MALTNEFILLATAILLLLSIFSSKLSDKIGVPGLLFFLIIGMVAGSDGPGGIYFDNPHVTQFIGTLALIEVLFSGGLEAKWGNIKPIVVQGIALSTIGILITALLVATLAFFTLPLTFKESFLLGAIVSSTDAAAIFSVFKSKGLRIPNKLRTLIEFESVSNDPMAVLLTVWTMQLFISPTASTLQFIFMFILQIVVGTAVGLLMGKLIPWTINKVGLEQKGLYPVLTIGFILLTYSLTTLLKGSGFLAVFLAGLMVGNEHFVHKKALLQFHDGITWLMQIIIFLTLGLLVFPAQLVQVLGIDMLFALFLMLIIRPLAVFGTLIFSKLNGAEKLMISWMGLRGAVPIILATFPMVAGIPKSEMFFNLVFFIVFTSILIQGASIPYVARWLKLDQ